MVLSCSTEVGDDGRMDGWREGEYEIEFLDMLFAWETECLTMLLLLVCDVAIIFFFVLTPFSSSITTTRR
jgi:hypothetical protein